MLFVSTSPPKTVQDKINTVSFISLCCLLCLLPRVLQRQYRTKLTQCLLFTYVVCQHVSSKDSTGRNWHSVCYSHMLFVSRVLQRSCTLANTHCVVHVHDDAKAAPCHMAHVKCYPVKCCGPPHSCSLACVVQIMAWVITILKRVRVRRHLHLPYNTHTFKHAHLISYGGIDSFRMQRCPFVPKHRHALGRSDDRNDDILRSGKGQMFKGYGKRCPFVTKHRHALGRSDDRNDDILRSGKSRMFRGYGKGSCVLFLEM